MRTRNRTPVVRYLLISTGGALGLLLLIGGVRAWLLKSRQVASQESPTIEVASDAVTHLAKAVQYKTITKRDPAQLDSAAYDSLYAYLERAFPQVHRTLDTAHVHDLSRHYTWPGTDTAKAPVVLMAHIDVVPVEPGTRDAWTHPPFSGAIADGHVWGRGSLDDKAGAVSILEALSTMIQHGERPSRTVHVAFGHDEEVGGPRGARTMAERITGDGTEPAIVLDEGGAVTKGALPGLTRPLAVVGIAEKGYLSVELTATGPGGHSSVPPDSTSIERLNAALHRLIANPLPARLDGVMGQTLADVAPEMPFYMQLVLANQWLTGPAIKWALRREPATEAAIKTVQVPTRLNAGVKDNVIPASARATINYRILPRHSVDRVLRHIRTTTEGLGITIEKGQVSPPTSVSAVDDPAFQMVQRTIREVTSDSVVVAPYLVPGATDSRYYADATDRVYRFRPYTLTPDKRGLIHGTNERMAIDDYRTMVRFYVQALRNADALTVGAGA
ncbi:MAG: peptidase M20 [Bacteroidetes bacterium SW_9_63_38]|nr:MAG: peptidase M20 [Bacteroidetes bacterium SW_9_63_38]